MYSLPPELYWAARQLSGYAHQTVQVNPTGVNTAGPSGLLQFDLPIAKYDLRTLTLAFDVTAWSTTADARTVLPYHAHSFFASQTTSVGGQVIESMTQRNHLAQILYDFTGQQNQSFDSVTGLSGATQYTSGVSAALPAVGYMGTQVNVGGNAPISNLVSDPTQGASVNAYPATMKFPLGFLSSMNILDLELTGPITIQLQTSDNSILMCGTQTGATPPVVTVAPQADCSFSIANARLLVNKVNIAESLYSQIKEQHRAQHGAIELPYKRWYAFSRGAVTGSTSVQANVQTESLNAAIATFTPQLPYDKYTIEPSRNPWCVHNATGLQSTSIIYSGEQYPQFSLPVAYSANMTGNLFENNYNRNVGALVPATSGGLPQFLTKMYAFGYRWSINNDVHDISGLRTMGNAAPVEWRMQYTSAPTAANAVNAQLFLETTARLLCGENREVALVP
jgi:hypothetical protein